LREIVHFAALPWQQGAHPLERKKTVAAGGATLLEFAPGFADPNWCENGHVGYVISGALGLEFADATERVEAGEAFVVEPGTKHRAFNPDEVAVVLFIAPRGATRRAAPR
jgi:quercetin dioxygenase-like cupin family protein